MRRCPDSYRCDTQKWLSWPSKSEEPISSLDLCLVSRMEWMRVNKLKFNPDKTEVLLVSQKANQGIGMQPVLDEVALLLKTQVYSFGVLLDLPLSLDAQVSAVARSTFAQIKLKRQLCPFLERSDVALVSHVLVTSWPNYCNVLHMELSMETSVGPKHTANWDWVEGSHNLPVTAAPLVAELFLGRIQSVRSNL